LQETEEKQKSAQPIAAQRIDGFLKFATLLQQRYPKSPEITPNYGKSGGSKSTGKAKEKIPQSLAALRDFHGGR